ncbi:MAG: hypothetical protein JWR07_3165 [Nevskia sp.]|nr:hypothetical protein [Nevskia sp.]
MSVELIWVNTGAAAPEADGGETIREVIDKPAIDRLSKRPLPHGKVRPRHPALTP